MAALFFVVFAAVLALSAADPVVELREPTPTTIEVATARSGMDTAPAAYQIPEPQEAPRGIRCGISTFAANSALVSGTVRRVVGDAAVERLVQDAERCKVTTTTPSLRGSMPPGTYELDDCCTSDRMHDNLLKRHSDEVTQAMSNIFAHLMTYFRKEEGVDFSINAKEFGMEIPGLTSVESSNESEETDSLSQSMMSALDEDEDQGEGVQRVRPLEVLDQVVDELDAEAASAQARLEALESQAEEDVESDQASDPEDLRDEADADADALEDSDAAEAEEEEEEEAEEVGPSDELDSDMEDQEEDEEDQGNMEGGD